MWVNNEICLIHGKWQQLFLKIHASSPYNGTNLTPLGNSFKFRHYLTPYFLDSITVSSLQQQGGRKILYQLTQLIKFTSYINSKTKPHMK